MQVNGHVYPEIGGHQIGQTFKNPRLVYKNLGNGRFKDVSAEMGPGITEHFSSRGAAFGDYDNDGDIDVLVLNMNDLPSLLRNDGGNKQNWIKIKLIGTKCNRTAIGARVRVVTGKHAQMDEVHSGSSVMSQSDLRLHFGLGGAQTVDVIEVKWPTTQKVERFTQVKANQILTIREGDGIVGRKTPRARNGKESSAFSLGLFLRRGMGHSPHTKRCCAGCCYKGGLRPGSQSKGNEAALKSPHPYKKNPIFIPPTHETTGGGRKNFFPGELVVRIGVETLQL